MYFFVNKFCNDNDIVAVLDADDAFIGAQPLKILNKAYEDPNIWYAWTRFVAYNLNNKIFLPG